MELLCRICGEPLQPENDMGVCECENCGSRQTFPVNFSDEQLDIFNNARRLRQKTDFEGAERLLSKLSSECPDEPENYWELLLCRCGIVYEDSEGSPVKIPVCHRASLNAVGEDLNFLTAIAYAADEQKDVYCREAAAIDILRSEFAERVGNGERYDVFMCSADSEKGSTIASEIYEQLCKEGFSVFFAQRTVGDVRGKTAEIYINAAISSAETLIVVSSGADDFAEKHLKSLWSRGVSALHKDSRKLLITCISNVADGDIPHELAGYPVRDINRIGAVSEIIRLIRRKDSNDGGESCGSASARTTPEKLIRRMNIFLADEDFEAAEEYCGIILDASPMCWQAHWGRFLAFNGCRNNGDLLLEEVVDSFADDYIVNFGFDFAEDEAFGRQLAQLLGEPPRKALEYAQDEEKVKLTTVYERFVNAVRDAVFAKEQEKIDGEEKLELENIRRQHEEDEERRNAAQQKKQDIRNRFLAYAAVIFTVLIVLFVKFHFIWAAVLIIIMIVITVLVLGGLSSRD